MNFYDVETSFNVTTYDSFQIMINAIGHFGQKEMHQV